ncbi:MAG: ERCC4 domain-containing protein [Clostridiales bacterium]|nr:ERCC4 domain-containing protein [Clostridiales bacterium]MBQ1575131.1 ERCC4 domain-containing protein [Clostridiales bacterium]
MIIVDSREKKWDHIRRYFELNGIEYVVQKLDVGDYSNTEKAGIVIDRKQNLQEIASNLSKGDGNIMRFTREAARAKEQNCRLIVLVEGTSCKNVKDVRQWKSKYTKMSGQWLNDKMFNLTLSYGVEWMFCRKNETPKKILELIGYEQNKDKIHSNT